MMLDCSTAYGSILIINSWIVHSKRKDQCFSYDSFTKIIFRPVVESDIFLKQTQDRASTVFWKEIL